MNTARSLTDNRALLHTVRNRLVRAVAGEDTPYATAVFEVLAQRERCWTYEGWAAACAEVDTSRQTVQEFLEVEHNRRTA